MSMSALICSSSQPVVIYNASTLCVSISLPTPYFFFPTSWSQAWVGWLLCHRIKRVTHTQKAYLSLGSVRVLPGAEGSLPGRAHVFFSTFVIRLIKAACSRGRVPARGARSVLRVRCVNVSEIRAAWSSAAHSSQGLLSASREAFISVPDPLRNLSHAETDLISPILYANAHQRRRSAREVLINICLICTRETSWENPASLNRNQGSRSLSQQTTANLNLASERHALSFKSYVNTTKIDYLYSKLTRCELCLLSVMWPSLIYACVPSIIIISVQDQDAFSGAVM